jgi:predicted transcriptional regulator of viral defense system
MATATQRDRLMQLLEDQPLARARDLKAAGIDAPTIARAVRAGAVIRAGRGLYQLPGSELDLESTLAEASKRVPKGVICMISALAHHQLTDQMPRKVWMAIGPRDWEPAVDYPPLRIVRLRSPYLEYGIERHLISGVAVPVYSIPKSLADAFRSRRFVDRSVAVECLRNAIEQRKATPAELAQAAEDSGAWKQMRPYLEAVTANGLRTEQLASLCPAVAAKYCS